MPALNATQVNRLLIGCGPALWRYVRRRVDDRDTTDEIVQEVSLRAPEGHGPLDTGSFLAWRVGIARHVLGMECRRRRRVRTQVSLEDPCTGELRDPTAGPGRIVDARVSLKRVLGNSEGAALLVRHYVRNGVETANDLAHELGLSPAALRMRMVRLRAPSRTAPNPDDPACP